LKSDFDKNTKTTQDNLNTLDTAVNSNLADIKSIDVVINNHTKSIDELTKNQNLIINATQNLENTLPNN
jgi:hypothetical protein